jgi:hypothetical protein
MMKGSRYMSLTPLPTCFSGHWSCLGMEVFAALEFCEAQKTLRPAGDGGDCHDKAPKASPCAAHRRGPYLQ